jgi:hypothetical protein
MRGRKLLVLGLVAGLVVGSLGAPVEAKKKKKKKLVPTPVSYYIQHIPEPVCSEETSYWLSVTPGEDNGACGNLGYGAFAEAAIQAGEGDFLTAPYIFSARDGVPFVLDATKPLTGTITVKSATRIQGQSVAPMGVGQATLEVLVTATSQGETVELGATTVEYLVTPGSQPAPVEFEIALDEGLNKASFTSLELSLRNRGATVQHGYYGSGNQSFVTVPTLAKKK